ncbi:MAG: SIMPL domain-containing protein, partial [Pseudomonadota bacterium]
AILTLTVTRQETTARAALDANSTAMGQVLEAMKADGIAERDLQTSGFSINPQYQYTQNEQPQLTGYRVSNSLTVRLRDLDKLGAIIDKSVTLGVNQGGQIRFTNDDPSDAITQARTAAVRDARAKATTLTEAAGVSLGRIVEINEQLQRPQPMPIVAQRASLEAADAAVPIAAGENEYQVNVNVTFEIAQ